MDKVIEKQMISYLKMYCKEIAKEVDFYFAETKKEYRRRLWDVFGEYLEGFETPFEDEEQEDEEAFWNQTLEHFLTEEESDSFFMIDMEVIMRPMKTFLIMNSFIFLTR